MPSNYNRGVAEQGDIAQYDLPVLTSRRGITQALVALSGVYAVLFAATGIDRFIDGALISLMAVLFLIVTSTFIGLNNPATRIAIVAPLCVPLFIAAAASSSTTTALMFAAVGLEVLFFGYLFLLPGTLIVNVRGVQRRRLITSDFSFDEISGVKEFDSRLGKHLRHIGFGSANVELLLFSWKRIPLNIRPDQVSHFIDLVSRNIDPAVQYDLFFLPPAEKASAPAAATPEEQEVKPLRRRGKKAKRLQGQQQAAPQTPTAAR